MTRRLLWLPTLIAAGALAACSDRRVDDDEDAVCEPACSVDYGPEVPGVGVGECVAGSCAPTFMECFENTEFSTCEAQCESIGSTCVEDGCAGGTYMINSNVEECLDPELAGVVISRGCEEPIDWQINTGARCCCEQNL